MSRDEDIQRTFEGQAVLQKLLTASGSIVDVEDVATAFAEASSQGVPAPVVIQALWEDEPRFSSPDEAARLFGNLLGLYELVAAGQKVDLTQSVERVKRVKAQKPEPFGEAGPTDDFVEAAWRYFDDYPKERERHAHAFENRQDALISWLDASGLTDAAFGLTRFLLGEVFAMLELGGHHVPKIDERTLPTDATFEGLPEALSKWIEEQLFDAQDDEEQPVTPVEAEKVKSLVAQVVQGMLRSA